MMKKTVYSASKLPDGTLVYIGYPMTMELESHPDGGFFVPTGMTLIAPPSHQPNKVAVLNESTKDWSLVDDHRGESWYDKDGTRHFISCVGECVPVGKMTTPPPSEFHTTHDGTNWIVDEALRLKITKAALADYRYKKEVSGLTVNGVKYQTDRESRYNATYLTVEGLINGMVKVNWKKADGTFELLEPRNFKQVAKAIFNYANDCYGREQELIADIDAASDPSLVDITSGWPSDSVTVKFTY